MAKREAANPVDSLWERILGWLPGWLGFVLIILAGVASILVGAITAGTGAPSAGWIAFGIAAIASSILAWVTGATSESRINPFELSFGGYVSRVVSWVWLVVFGLFVIASIIAIVTR